MSDFLVIREIVNQFDPMGLIGMGAPDDEHDRLTQKIIRSLYDHNIDKIKDLLIDCYDEYGSSGRDIKEEYQESFNRKIQTTYNQIEVWYLNKNKPH
ncbi:hypothetical protein [Paenibacillus sp. WC2504]|uniref:hypothetical protein n=1 Tax=Paenibacillus sp. WC2504 TaxID=3461403 RepID=UPI00404651FA